ncbi:hypothetical protein L906_27320 [Agrobacterium sp. TS45]|nr:hypothetical protein L906_27320 [Agrobacterium sp. TS45]
MAKLVLRTSNQRNDDLRQSILLGNGSKALKVSSMPLHSIKQLAI